MKICPVCSAKNENTALVCVICSQTLMGVKLDPTRSVFDTTQQYAPITWGDIHLKPNAVLVLYMLTSGELRVLPKREELVIGRVGVAGLRAPDIDLTPYGAVACGVSRRHAALEIQAETVFIRDLGSTNGTYLNGSLLAVSEARIIRTGDEIRFANLATQLYFRAPVENEF